MVLLKTKEDSTTMIVTENEEEENWLLRDILSPQSLSQIEGGSAAAADRVQEEVTQQERRGVVQVQLSNCDCKTTIINKHYLVLSIHQFNQSTLGVCLEPFYLFAGTMD
jgi:hypothetical protein